MKFTTIQQNKNAHNQRKNNKKKNCIRKNDTLRSLRCHKSMEHLQYVDRNENICIS